MTSPADARAHLERNVESLSGRRIHAVDYWDLHNFAPEQSRWDYGDWHHAVMGVQLTTDLGPVTVTWEGTFYQYGVAAHLESIDRHVLLGPEGAERIGPDGPGVWARLLDGPITAATLWWDTVHLPAARRSNGEVTSPARSVDWPTSLRVDTAGGPVWFVAAMPMWPDMGRFFVGGDEIMVVFSADRMRALGFDDPSFVR